MCRICSRLWVVVRIGEQSGTQRSSLANALRDPMQVTSLNHGPESTLETLLEDALQETYYLMFQKLHYLKEPHAFRSWLSRIALHTCYDLLRRSKPAESLSSQHEETAKPYEPLDVVPSGMLWPNSKRKTSTS